MYIDEWEWDDGNIYELTRHGIEPRTVYQVPDGRPHLGHLHGPGGRTSWEVAGRDWVARGQGGAGLVLGALMGGEKQERDLARTLHEQRGDADEWSEEEEQIEVRPARTTVVSVRLPADEFLALEAAARATGESVSQYVRRAIELRQRGVAPQFSSVSVSFGNPAIQLRIADAISNKGLPVEQDVDRVSVISAAVGP